MICNRLRATSILFLEALALMLLRSPLTITGFTTKLSLSNKYYNSHTPYVRQQVTFLSTPTTIADGQDQETPLITKAKQNKPNFKDFNYLNQWYPVIWDRDLKLNKLEKVTVFDVDYVVTKTTKKDSDDVIVYTLLDKCPHRCAALSEGRCTSSGLIQCAYHGWSFDKEGTCVEIPQSDATEYSSRTNVASIPTRVHQGMVWVYPGSSISDGSIKSTKSILPEIPSVPELNNSTYSIVTSVVRDFPLDWTVLIENIIDPDHGLFAHQQATSFDLYSASTEHPQSTREDFDEDNGDFWTITSNVSAVPKLSIKKQKIDDTKAAVTTFIAPSLIYMGRRNKITNETTFLTAFWITPTGTGKSRFMSASISNIKLPFKIPRWLAHMQLMNFLDQDTYLLITAQKYILEAERNYYEGVSPNNRKSVFHYASPTEKLLSRVGTFWDNTLANVPFRKSTLKRMDLTSTITREVALDRYQQHTKVCPDTQGFLKKSKMIQKGSLVSMVVSIAGVLVAKNALWKRVSAFVGVSSSIVYMLMKKCAKEFYFKYTNEFRDRDMDKIPSVYVDKEL